MSTVTPPAPASQRRNGHRPAPRSKRKPPPKPPPVHAQRFRIDPVTGLAATFTLGSQVVLGLQYVFAWSGTATGLIGGIWTALIGLLGSPFAKAQVTSNRVVDERVQKLAHDTIVALAPMAPGANGAMPVKS